MQICSDSDNLQSFYMYLAVEREGLQILNSSSVTQLCQLIHCSIYLTIISATHYRKIGWSSVPVYCREGVLKTQLLP